MHSLTTGMLAQTKAKSLRPCAFVEVDSLAGNVYFWTGSGPIVWNALSWTGAGFLLSISPITEQNQVQATGVELALSGIPSALVSYALQSVGRYMPASVWVGAIDDAGNIIPDPFLIMSGRTDRARIEDDGTTATIKINTENRLITMRTPAERRHTKLDQSIERPGDTGFDYADFLQDASIYWGNGHGQTLSSAGH